MEDTVLIFGQDLCQYTSAARADFARRKIPVIVDAGKITVGFGGT